MKQKKLTKDIFTEINDIMNEARKGLFFFKLIYLNPKMLKELMYKAKEESKSKTNFKDVNITFQGIAVIENKYLPNNIIILESDSELAILNLKTGKLKIKTKPSPLRIEFNETKEIYPNFNQPKM